MFNRPYVHIPDEHLPEIDDLPGELPLVAEAVEDVLPGMGVRVALILAQRYPGQPIYMHNVTAIVDAYQYELMRAEYDRGGCTVRDLARKYGIPLRRAERAISSSPKQKDQRQLSLF